MVTLIRRIDRNWYDGRIGNRKGIFPVSYVDVICEPGVTIPQSPKPISTPVMGKDNGETHGNYVPPNLNITSPYTTAVSLLWWIRKTGA